MDTFAQTLRRVVNQYKGIKAIRGFRFGSMDCGDCASAQTGSTRKEVLFFQALLGSSRGLFTILFDKRNFDEKPKPAFPE